MKITNYFKLRNKSIFKCMSFRVIEGNFGVNCWFSKGLSTKYFDFITGDSCTTRPPREEICERGMKVDWAVRDVASIWSSTNITKNPPPLRNLKCCP